MPIDDIFNELRYIKNQNTEHMKNTCKFLFLTLLLCMTMGCSSKDDITIPPDDDTSQTDDDDNGSSSSLTYELIDIQIDLPDGMNLDISNTYVESLLSEYEIKSDYTASINVLKDKKSLVYLRNTDGEIILMGFISKEHPILDARSTLDASLFFRLGTVFRLPEIKEKFLNEFRDLTEIEPFVSELEEMYKTDALVLKSDTFKSWLNDVAGKLVDNKKVIDIQDKVLIANNSIKSGIKVAQNSGNVLSVDVTNYYRRRARAFFYKVAVKKNGEFETLLDLDQVITSHETSLEPNIELDVSPVTGITSIQGGTIDVIIGNGSDVGFKTSGPTELELLDNDEASKYIIRVLGPGRKSTLIHTKEEGDALLQMQLETFLLDFLVPSVTTMLGIGDIADTYIGFLDIDTGKELLNAALASTPGALDALDDGNLVTAVYEFGKALIGNAVGTEKFFEVVFVKPLKSMGMYTTVEDLKGKLAAPLTFTNALLTSFDGYRIIDDIYRSSQLERYESTVTRSKVRISPYEKGIVLGEQVEYEATSPDIDETTTGNYYYKWRTTAIYGELTENYGAKQITYKSNPDYGTLPQNAHDSIYVDIYQKGEGGLLGSLVGKDSTIVNISPTKYKIRPDGITIDGDSKLTLRVVDPDNVPIANSDSLYYKIVWQTQGNYGKLNGTDISLTTYVKDGSSVYYETFDQETASAAELVSAKIYSSTSDLFNGDDSELTLVDEIEATINIENRDDVLIYYTKVGFDKQDSPLTGFPDYTHWEYWSEWKWNSSEAVIPDGYEVQQVSMRIIERIPDLNPSCSYTSNTWSLEPGESMEPTYTVYCGGSGFNVGPDLNQGTLAYMESLYGSVKGYAKVTVYLRVKN
ncbi:hypothetical protein D2U88_02980 [Flagellimonas aequoris]|uniref:Uncharacterized protein n=2 Tax=Flagellimonas aequoris TaxID=2306997 RepID=A0A418NAZ9_9FLAO|nr:hypothetical protein D2U88_02980 [Allomuricauda aequoris]